MFDAPPQQPQSVGDLIGRAFRIYRSHWKAFMYALMWPIIIGTIGKVLLQWGVLQFKTPPGIGMLALSVVATSAGFLVSLLAAWFVVLRLLAFVRMVDGFAGDFKEAYAAVGKRKWGVIAVSVVGYVITVVMAFAWTAEIVLAALLWKASPAASVAGIILGILGMVVSVLLVSQVWCVVFAVLACETRSLGSVIGRGTVLVLRDPLRSMGFSLLIFFTLWLLNSPLTLPIVLLNMFELARAHTTDATAVPFYCLVITLVWESMITMIVWPVSAIAYGLFYYDLRMRQEGLDLDQGLTLLTASKATI